MTPSPPPDASGTTRGLMGLVVQTFAGVKTFLATIVASAGIQVASLFNTNGTGASDVGVMVGVSTADGSVNTGAKPFSVRTGIGGTEVEKFAVSKLGPYVRVGGGSTFADPVFWFDTSASGARENIIQIGAGLTSTTWEFALGLFAGPYPIIKARSGMYLSTPFLSALTPNGISLGGTGQYFKDLYLGETVQLGKAGTARPAASASTRGTFWYSLSAGGAADTVQVCLKSAADTYSWVTIATG